MSDLISRQAAIDALDINRNPVFHDSVDYEGAMYDICKLPSAQPDLDEWCTDCSEYDQERHCCPRWNRVIRQTLKDAQPERKTGEWIPCSERLPEVGDKVLASTKNTVFTEVFKGTHESVNTWWWTNNTIKIVYAWMSLPEPYKGDKT